MDKVNNNKILVITTEGCEACEIAKNNILIAKADSKVDINVQVENHKNLDKEFLKRNNIKDYPTVLYIINDIIIKKAVGSFPSAVYLRWIDMYFKF